MLVNIFIPLMFTLIPIILFVRFPISIANPTSRGLHHKPTASSGGIAILIGYVAITISAMILHGHNLTTNSMILPIVLASLLGFFDDKVSLSKITRFVIQTILAIWIIYINPELPSYIKIFWLLLVIYFINIYNFMDGINGLATSQAIFTLISMIILDNYYGINQIIILLIPLLVFLIFNISPAKIFLGNAGSYLIAILLIMLFYRSSHIDNNYLNIDFYISMFIILTVFICDSSYTLLSRLIHQYSHLNKNFISSLKCITNPHRTHNYQIMAEKLGNHNTVTIFIMLYNFFWCLPLAFLSQTYSQLSIVFLLLSYIPYGILCFKNKAGVENR